MKSAAVQARELLLRKPSLIDTRKAALRLIAESKKCSPETAQVYFGRLSVSQIYVDLFKAALPAEFKADTGPRTTIVKRFFQALGFPVSEWALESLIDGRQHPIHIGIPVAGLGVHICDDCFNFSEFPVQYQLAVILFDPFGPRDYGLLEEHERSDFDEAQREQWDVLQNTYALPEGLRPRDPVDWSALAAIFQTVKSPLRFLPTVNRAICHNTGSIFLDFDPEEGLDGCPPWTPGNVVWLREQFALAKNINRDIDRIADWLKVKTRARVVQALRLYQQAKENDSNRRKAPEGRKLARVL